MRVMVQEIQELAVELATLGEFREMGASSELWGLLASPEFRESVTSSELARLWICSRRHSEQMPIMRRRWRISW